MHLKLPILFSDRIINKLFHNKEKADCAIKQEFLDNSIDPRFSHYFLHRQLQNRRAGVRRGCNLLSGARNQFPI